MPTPSRMVPNLAARVAPIPRRYEYRFRITVTRSHQESRRLTRWAGFSAEIRTIEISSLDHAEGSDPHSVDRYTRFFFQTPAPARDTDPKWRKLCALTSVSRMVEDAEKIVRDLAGRDTRGGLTAEDPFSPYGYGHSTVTELDEEE